ncbi:hypothetical protein [Leptospira andrefontaineae]|uniref:Lipoprotein n=1 Tax=Leptospira andrefontaineae TaxID=2484976 RepID=A0A4R9HD37_9LEPT|nr:hypothetical protein [Leptospira andrefontaineae]TGK44664.1 hypothetical protein EHO65_01080 [Leptospira andrefontaineae]
MNLRNCTFISLLLLTFIAFFSCAGAGEIKINKDEFKNSQIVQLKLWSFRCEEPELFNVNFQISREFTDSKIQPFTVVRFIITAPEKSFDLEQDSFIKIDERKFNVKLEGMSVNVKGEAYSGTRKDPATGKEESYSGVHVSKQLKGIFQFTKEQEGLILESNQFLLRLYSGSSPLTFIIKEKKLAKLKEFLKTIPPTETQPTNKVVPDTKDQKKTR